MKPGLLPPMLLRDMYAVMAFLSPNFPVSKSVANVGPVSKSVADLGPTSSTVSSVGLGGCSLEVPT